MTSVQCCQSSSVGIAPVVFVSSVMGRPYAVLPSKRSLADSLSMTRVAIVLLFLAVAGCATVPTSEPGMRAEVGVAFDRNGDIASFADGIADTASRRAITIDDPVRVASVSKMVTAIGVMKL